MKKNGIDSPFSSRAPQWCQNCHFVFNLAGEHSCSTGRWLLTHTQVGRWEGGAAQNTGERCWERTEHDTNASSNVKSILVFSWILWYGPFFSFHTVLTVSSAIFLMWWDKACYRSSPKHSHVMWELEFPLVLPPYGLTWNTSKARGHLPCLPKFSWLPLSIKEQPLDIEVRLNHWDHSLYHVARDQPPRREILSWLLVCEIKFSLTAKRLRP